MRETNALVRSDHGHQHSYLVDTATVVSMSDTVVVNKFILNCIWGGENVREVAAAEATVVQTKLLNVSIVTDDNCPLWQSGKETLLHCFVQCDIARSFGVWFANLFSEIGTGCLNFCPVHNIS